MTFPGPKSRAAIDELLRYVIADPYPFVVDIKNSSGMWLKTIDGQRLFDWAGFYGSKLLGHNHPAMCDPRYLEELAIAANNKVANPDFLTPQCLEYYRLLHKLAPLCMRNDRLEVYAVNSGAEAIENMMKYMINLYDEKQRKRNVTPKNRRFIYFDQAFHGRTVFALNVTQLSHDPVINKNFRGLIPGNIQVPFPSIDNSQPPAYNDARTAQSLAIVRENLERYQEEIVGIVVEPIQGAGGHRVAAPAFFRGLSELAHDFEVYLGFDEVQTAGGQTGSIFAIDQFDLPYPPNAVAVAKKFANGAVYMLHPMEDRGILDSTWGGNLADMVRFCREMKVVEEEKLLEKVSPKALLLGATLRELERQYQDLIFNVRGMGLYQGFTFRRQECQKSFLEYALQQENLLLLSAGAQTVRLRPPLTVEDSDIRELSAALARCLAALK